MLHVRFINCDSMTTDQQRAIVRSIRKGDFFTVQEEDCNVTYNSKETRYEITPKDARQ